MRDPFFYHENGSYYIYSSGMCETGLAFVCRRSADLVEVSEPKVIFAAGEGFWADKCFWAPEMHKYKDKYYLFGTICSADRKRGTQIFVSDAPDGSFVPLTEYPVTPDGWTCLDGTLFVENDVPYLIFCREWVEIGDGEMYIARLSDDLKTISEPVKLFSASEASWTHPLSENNYVTDGPFVIKRGNKYKMLWSSFTKCGYAMGVCESTSLFGPWEHCPEPINHDNGGHGMIFTDKGREYIVYHAPNDPCGAERIRMLDKAI